MDEIEAGFEKILQKIEDLKGKEAGIAEKIRKNDAALLDRMAHSSIPVVKSIGLASAGSIGGDAAQASSRSSRDRGG